MFFLPSRILLSTRACTEGLLVDCRMCVAALIRAFSRSILRYTSAITESVSDILACPTSFQRDVAGSTASFSVSEIDAGGPIGQWGCVCGGLRRGRLSPELRQQVLSVDSNDVLEKGKVVEEKSGPEYSRRARLPHARAQDARVRWHCHAARHRLMTLQVAWRNAATTTPVGQAVRQR
jgi:hypothetical protein